MREHLVSAARSIGEAGMAPFAALPPLLGVIGLALALSLLFLLAQRLLTHRRRMSWIRSQMAAVLLELRLFADSPRQVLMSQARALWLTLEYLVRLVPPLLAVALLAGPILARSMLHWDHRSAAVGQTILLSIAVAPGSSVDDLRLDPVSSALRLVPPIVRLRSQGVAHVRLRAREAGRHGLHVRLGAHRLVAQLQAETTGAVSLVRARARDMAQLLGDEAPLPDDGALARLTLRYPERDLRWLGRPWYLWLVLVSLASVLILRRRFGVTL
jgi:hypothetical protein